jgi:hypothetical protein
MPTKRLTPIAQPNQDTIDALRCVCANLRESDRREINALHWDEDPDRLVRSVLYCPDAAWLAWIDSRPVAAVGATPMWPGVWSVWAFGTDEFRQVGLLLTKHVRRFIIPMIQRASGHRAECKTIEGHHEAHRWLESFGLQREGTHPGYGRNGETFHTYARTEMGNVRR